MWAERAMGIHKSSSCVNNRIVVYLGFTTNLLDELVADELACCLNFFFFFLLFVSLISTEVQLVSLVNFSVDLG